MPNLMVQATPLPNVRGRIRYASSPKKQENLLATYDGAADLLEGKYWKTLAQECRTAYEQFGDKSKKCCEGRELMVLLSNSLLERMTPDEIVKTIAEEVKEKLGLDCFVALHFNKTKKSLHAHIIFGERELLQEPVIKTAERNLFYNAEGKRCYKKSEILDENKQLLPGCKIIKKGEVYEQRYFSSVDTKYHERDWLADVKTNVFLALRNGKLKGDVEITEYDASTGKLAQQPIGKKTDPETAAAIEANNENVKRFNQFVDEKVIPQDAALKIQKAYKKLPKKNAYLNNVVKRAREYKQELYIAKTRAPWYKVGEIAGIDRTEIDNFFEQREKPWSDKKLAWSGYKEAKNQFWEEYNVRKAELQRELKKAYKTRQKVKNAYWLTDERNRQRSLIGTIYACIVIAKNNSLSQINHEIEQLKKAQSELYSDMAAFKENSGTVREMLFNRDIRLDGYIDALKALQDKADLIYEQAEHEERKSGYRYVDELVKRAEDNKSDYKKANREEKVIDDDGHDAPPH